MPTLAELRGRYAEPTLAAPQTNDSDEEFVVDARGSMSPTQMVEAKLRSALLGGALASADFVTSDGKRRAAK